MRNQTPMLYQKHFDFTLQCAKRGVVIWTYTVWPIDIMQ